jgi:hypothetical protein
MTDLLAEALKLAQEAQRRRQAIPATPEPETGASGEIQGPSVDAICERSFARGARAVVVAPGSAAWSAWVEHLRSTGQEAFAAWVEGRGRKGVPLIVPKEFPTAIGGEAA